jgi:hypothetical protein
MRLYDLRHSFGAELYRRTGDLATVARFLGHAPGSTVTARYALGANAHVDRAAAAAFDTARAAEQQQRPAEKAATRNPRRNRTGSRMATRTAKARYMTPDFSAADSTTWPLVLTPEHMSAIYSRTVGAIKKACQLHRFIPRRS